MLPPAIDLAAEKRLIDCLVALANERAIVSAHDVSDGGLAVTVAESCFTGETDALSAEINLSLPQPSSPGEKPPAEVLLFQEAGTRAVVSLAADSLARVAQIAAQWNVVAARIGTVTRSEFRIQLNGQMAIPAVRGGYRFVPPSMERFSQRST